MLNADKFGGIFPLLPVDSKLPYYTYSVPCEFPMAKIYTIIPILFLGNFSKRNHRNPNSARNSASLNNNRQGLSTQSPDIDQPPTTLLPRQTVNHSGCHDPPDCGAGMPEGEAASVHVYLF